MTVASRWNLLLPMMTLLLWIYRPQKQPWAVTAAWIGRSSSHTTLRAAAGSQRGAAISCRNAPSVLEGLRAAQRTDRRHSYSSSTFGMRAATTSLFSSSSPSNEVEQEKDPGKVEGTDLQIVKYPHPSLRADNAEISKDQLKDGSIGQLAKEMFLLMYAAEGVGLAAPQVGKNVRLMVFSPSGDPKRWLDEVVLVNPYIVDQSQGMETAQEACLSFPDMRGDVARHKWIKVEAMNLKGKKIKKKYEGWEARIFQHEYDHLDGTCYIDRLSEEGRAEIQPKLDALIADFGEGGAI